jgi:hypothetical protein
MHPEVSFQNIQKAISLFEGDFLAIENIILSILNNIDALLIDQRSNSNLILSPNATPYLSCSTS